MARDRHAAKGESNMMNQTPYDENDALLRMTVCGGEARVALLRTTHTAQRAGDIHNASATRCCA